MRNVLWQIFLALAVAAIFPRPVITRSAAAKGNEVDARPLLAATPPMGWNSWDAYGTTVREAAMKANADYMAKNLVKHGWEYVVVDIQWYEPNAKGHSYVKGARLAMDEYGRLLPAVSRFPSAANGAGFKALADYVHGKGLKFGIHIMRGIPRQAVTENLPVKGTEIHASDIADKENSCRWNADMWGVDTTKPGAQAYYDSIADLYASWGVDFIKADDMASHLYQPAEIKALSQAIAKTHRAIVLSLSPGPAPITESDFFRKYAQMWRISDDFWDKWTSLKEQFARARDWAKFAQPGSWPDGDMLPLGRIGTPESRGGRRWTGLSRDEQSTLMTLWCMMRSPLMFGGDLPENDEYTLSLLTNPEVLAVDQTSSGNQQSLARGHAVAWVAEVKDSQDKYSSITNLGDTEELIAANWEELGISAKKAAVRDLWKRKDLGEREGIKLTLRPHASVLLRVSPESAAKRALKGKAVLAF